MPLSDCVVLQCPNFLAGRVKGGPRPNSGQELAVAGSGHLGSSLCGGISLRQRRNRTARVIQTSCGGVNTYGVLGLCLKQLNPIEMY